MLQIQLTVRVTSSINPHTQLSNFMLSQAISSEINQFRIDRLRNIFEEDHSHNPSVHSGYSMFEKKTEEFKVTITVDERTASAETIKSAFENSEIQLLDDSGLLELERKAREIHHAIEEQKKSVQHRYAMHPSTKQPLFNLNKLESASRLFETVISIECKCIEKSAVYTGFDMPYVKTESESLFPLLIQDLQSQISQFHIQNFEIQLFRNLFNEIQYVKMSIPAITFAPNYYADTIIERFKNSCRIASDYPWLAINLDSIKADVNLNVVKGKKINLQAHPYQILYVRDMAGNIEKIIFSLSTTEPFMIPNATATSWNNFQPDTIKMGRDCADRLIGLVFTETPRSPTQSASSVSSTSTVRSPIHNPQDDREKKYVEHMKQVFHLTEMTPKALEQAFRRAAGNAKLTELKWMFHFKSKYPFDIDGVSETGSKKTALHHCIERATEQHIRCAELLINNGADLELHDENQKTAKMLIGESENAGIRQLLTSSLQRRF